MSNTSNDAFQSQLIETNKSYNNRLLSGDLIELEKILQSKNQEAYNILKSKDFSIYPFKIKEYCEKLGLTIKESSDLSDSGEIDIEKKIIYINSTETEARQRFTLAHELGHYIFHQNYKKRSTDYYYNTEERAEEQLCNTFAGVLLMPEDALQEVFKKYGIVSLNKIQKKLYPSLNFLTDIFKVSEAAIKVRLSILGYPLLNGEF
jgi:Zn-dependent peptidase ImmA (M78 family)